MKTTVRVLGLLLVILAGTATGLEAQRLASGTWAGKSVDPGGEEADFTFEVESTADGIAITLITDEEKFALTQIRFEEGKLLFRWEPGIIVNCVLSPVDGGGFSGPCSGESGALGIITMTPPKP